MFAKISDGKIDQSPYTGGNLRRDNPNTSFPKRPDNTLLAEWGVYPVTKTERPAVDHTKNVVEGDPVLINGTWTQVWEIIDATAEEIAERTEQAAKSVRAKRDRLLDKSDWVVVRARELGQDVPIDWYTYRGDLRQIPDQPGFPHNVIWPTKPE